MNIEQLKQFKAIAEYQSITRAAEVLYITQPALTQSLKRIEKELGAQLFDRSNNSIALNAAGKAALAYAETIINTYETMCKSMHDFQVPEKTLHFYDTHPLMFRYLLPKFNAYCNEAGMPTYLERHIIEDGDMRDILLADAANIVFSDKITEAPDIRSLPLMERRMLVSVPVSNPLAKYDRLRLIQLNNQKFIGPITGLSPYTEAVLKKRDIRLDIIYIDDYTLFRELIVTSERLTFASTLTLEWHLNNPQRKIIPVTDMPELRQTYYLLYNKKQEKNLSIFLDWLHENYYKILKKTSVSHF